MPSTLQLQRILYQAVGSVVGSLLVPPSRAPVLDVQTTLGSYEASLTWTASNRTGSPGFGYRVEVDVNGGGFGTLTTTTDLFYTDSQLSAVGETYTYRITPINDYGEGPSSNEAGIVLPGESEGPVLTGPENVMDDSYVLEWTSVVGATSYDLYYVPLPDFEPLTLLANTANLEYEATSVFDSRQYYVVATNGSFESAPSNLHNVYLIMPAPTNQLALNAAGNILLNAGGAILIN